MDCIQSIQRAIEYMETHLLEEISYEEVARELHLSSYYFHRIFSMLTGMTANEYIRSRRLSLAGQELSASDARVIDVALKYGYESPESFAKAFSRFHGVTPNRAKKSGAKLQLFHRLVVKIKLEGGTPMEYKIVKREGFRLLTKGKAFRNGCISEADNTEIPDFWQQCRAEGVFQELEAHTAKHDIYGICAPITKESPCFDYAIGMEYEGGEIPDGFCVWEVTSTLWAVFPCMGQDAACIGETWERIYKEFLPGSDYNLLDGADFEYYPENGDPACFCEIWIPVEKK